MIHCRKKQKTKHRHGDEEQLICMAAQRKLIKQIMGFYQGPSSSSWVLYSCIFFFFMDKDIDEREHCLPAENCTFVPPPPSRLEAAHLSISSCTTWLNDIYTPCISLLNAYVAALSQTQANTQDSSHAAVCVSMAHLVPFPWFPSLKNNLIQRTVDTRHELNLFLCAGTPVVGFFHNQNKGMEWTNSSWDAPFLYSWLCACFTVYTQ